MENIKCKIGIIYFEHKLRLVNNEIDKLNAKANILNEFYQQNKSNSNFSVQTNGNIKVIKQVDKIFNELRTLVDKKLSFLNIIIYCKKQVKEEISIEFNADDLAHFVIQKNLYELLETLEKLERYEESETILSEIRLVQQIAA